MLLANSTFKMSKFSDDLENQLKDIRAVRNATKEVIGKGGKIAMQEYHEANSLEKLKKIIKESC